MALSTVERERQWNLPNLLTYARMVAVPVVAGCLFAPDDFRMRWLGLAVFVVAGITDFFDGYLARVWNQQSSLGRMLDPIAVTTGPTGKTPAQLTAIGFLIAGPAGEAVLPGTVNIGLVLLWVAAVLTLYTGWDYMKAGFRPVVE